MINQARIEKILLAQTRREGDDILRELHGGGTCLTADFYRVSRSGDGSGNSNPLSKLRQNDLRNFMFTGRDASAELKYVSYFTFFRCMYVRVLTES
jgi:structural maintenance of chromosomes protein 6